MTRFLLAGGGTGGHVNPLLALAEALRSEGHEVIALGTLEGLEQRLVPERGFELLSIERLPFPRKFSRYALMFPFKFFRAVFQSRAIIKNREIDCVVGFGGYASAPAYFAAWLQRVPLVIHEANALAGIANRLGSRLTKRVAIAFSNSDLQGELTGMPIRREIVDSVDEYDKGQARVEMGLDPSLPTLLVTGGSLGAKSINDAVLESLPKLQAAGIQVLHILGGQSPEPERSEPGYVSLKYCNRMDAAIAASDFAISRAGASTVSEFAACGLPAVYVPYPVGNGEQRLNAVTVVEAGGGLIVRDADFTSQYIETELIPKVSHRGTLDAMSKSAKSQGIPDSTLRLKALVLQAVNT
jgi:UDP-N-acetylglucosamine--N-acetylmuramyl-(pentapeptide) pyrophosphoryl-undecaprenol N-acetylglucosamine transferase